MENFANQIAELCLNKYKMLGKVGKPTDNEWTIVSGIVLKKENNELVLVALATGTKCLGESQLTKLSSEERGTRLSDSHAEVLARRAFLRYLYEQLDLVLTNASEIFIMDPERKIKIKNEISFHIFTSQTPCGDCSIFPKIDANSFMEPPMKIRKTNNEKNEKNQESIKEMNSFMQNDQIITDIYRTGAKCVKDEKYQDPRLPGADYHVVGCLRTKPGRGDPTLSLSCSDKIAKWNILGLQGALLSILIPPIRISSFTIGGGCPFSLEAMERGLYKRFNMSKLKIEQAQVSFEHRKGPERTRPCPSSIIWCNVKTRDTEVAVEGRKQGATKKKKANCLLVTRRALFERFLKFCDKYKEEEFNLRHPKKITYFECKRFSTTYRSMWINLQTGPFGAWPKKPRYFQKFVL